MSRLEGEYDLISEIRGYLDPIYPVPDLNDLLTVFEKFEPPIRLTEADRDVVKSVFDSMKSGFNLQIERKLSDQETSNQIPLISTEKIIYPSPHVFFLLRSLIGEERSEDAAGVDSYIRHKVGDTLIAQQELRYSISNIPLSSLLLYRQAILCNRFRIIEPELGEVKVPIKGRDLYPYQIFILPESQISAQLEALIEHHSGM